MVTFQEVYRDWGIPFEEFPQPDGTVLLRKIEPCSIANYGKIIELGKRYSSCTILVSEDGFQSLEFREMEGEYCEDPQAYADLVGIDSYEGLINLTSEEFFKEVERRREEREVRIKK